jgi:hypothetical protein
MKKIVEEKPQVQPVAAEVKEEKAETAEIKK